MTNKRKGWKELPIGGAITKAGNSKEYKTGDWRVQRPIFDAEKCSQCMICVIYCPDASIALEEGKVTGIDYDHCKGCGICANECPRQALEMKSEAEFKARRKEKVA
jgi:pyruvate ferredoxin oxidoreductase delta subunit